MKCLRPVLIKNKKVGFDHIEGHRLPKKTHLSVPCGKCMGCRILLTKEWAIRIQDETRGKKCSFITLTYDQESLPKNSSLSKEHLQLFFKRFRRHLQYNGEEKIVYFACGEYGDTDSRPHYHAIVIGWEEKKESLKRHGEKYSSKTLEKLWTYGYNTAESVNLKAIEYVTGYVRKKLNGKKLKEIYTDTGRIGPFSLYSKNLGIKYAIDNKEKIIGGRTSKGKDVIIPKSYKKKLAAMDKKAKEELLIKQIIKKSDKEWKNGENWESLEAQDRESRERALVWKERNYKKGTL